MPSFLFVDTHSFTPPQATAVLTPATGTTLRLGPGYHMIGGAGTIAALTVMLPPSPWRGQVFRLYPLVAVTTLTLQTATGGAIAGAPAAAVAGKPISLQWTGTLWLAEVD